MQLFKKFIGALFSRQMLAFIAMLLLACMVWFIGPLIAFSGLHPLAETGTRVAVIVMMLALLLFWLLRWPVSVIGVAAFCLLVWYAGPLLGIGETKPLAPDWARLLIISAVLFGFSVYGLYRLWQAMRSNDALLQRVLHPSANQPEIIAKDEIRIVGTTINNALAQLKRMRTAASASSRLFNGKRYLYELPWYMVIGTPGAGKTTAIANSGMQFPVAGASGSGATALPGQGGTAHCDWWFTNDAIFIDTAGRYTEQDEQRSESAARLNAAEWRGFLGLLRKHRTRAPINGAILTISAADLLGKPAAERKAMAAAMRARLAELRSELGIRFPVYVVVTKLDLLAGFGCYFQSLTSEGRAQVFGFTLPYREETEALLQSLRARCEEELALLERRLDAGMDNRLIEEFETARRKELYALPQEFRGLSVLLAETLDEVFSASRFDNTQARTTLRGVYFSSARQTAQSMPADRDTLFQRFKRSVAGLSGATNGIAGGGNKSFFLHDLFRRVIVPEARLVRPNLRWEFRFRMLRMASHALAVVLFLWMASALVLSFGNNREYLAAISAKTDALLGQLQRYDKAPDSTALPGLLSLARELPVYRRLDLERPAGEYRYGLYTAPSIVGAAHDTYGELQENLLLPQIVRRMENVLASSVAAQDSDLAYRTLSAYLMLFDKARYNGALVKSWVLQDWESTDAASAFGGRASMLEHLDALFAKDRVVQSPYVRNDDLVARARALLDARSATARLYERAKVAMQADAPDDFTLVRLLGPQAGTVFITASGAPLGQGVPGLFTYEGYHEVFSKRLTDFVAQARNDDVWVMGSRVAGAIGQDNADDELRRQYLDEYALIWEHFLDDIRPVTGADGATGGTGGTLALDLQTLRVLAAPDSPLVRLARAASRQTTLSSVISTEDSSLADKALDLVDRKTKGAAKALRLRPEQRMERERVDNRFAALREVVTGIADSSDTSAAPTSGARALQLDSLVGLLNEQYTMLVVADTALSGNSIPPTADVSARLRIEAAKLPAPFRAVLAGIATHAADQVNQGVGALLSAQMDATIGDACRRAIEGKYPFAENTQEVDAEDFGHIFASGGLLDDFFQKTLASHVDTSSRPWKYKLASPELPVLRGPELEAFQQAAAIREVFFRDSGAKRMGWKMDLRVAMVDPTITQLSIDIDGQDIRYAHGPVVPISVKWPGPRGGTSAEIGAQPRVKPETSTLMANGPWALFRLIDQGRLSKTASASQTTVDFSFDGRHAKLDLMTGSLPNPLNSRLLKDFHCPRGRL
jgi:type VI secretion system protein ImpL